MKRIAFVVALILVTTLVFVWRIPASAALAFVPMNEATKNVLKLHELRGTLWSGNARFSLSVIPATQSVTWACTPRVFSLSVDCELTGSIRGQLSIQALQRTLVANNLETTQALQWSGIANSAFSSELANVKIVKATMSPSLAHVTANAIAMRVDTVAANAPLSWGEVSLDCAPVDQAPASRCTLRNRASDNKLDGQIDINASHVSGNLTITPARSGAQRISF